MVATYRRSRRLLVAPPIASIQTLGNLSKKYTAVHKRSCNWVPYSSRVSSTEVNQRCVASPKCHSRICRICLWSGECINWDFLHVHCPTLNKKAAQLVMPAWCASWIRLRIFITYTSIKRSAPDLMRTRSRSKLEDLLQKDQRTLSWMMKMKRERCKYNSFLQKKKQYYSSFVEIRIKNKTYNRSETQWSNTKLI